MRPCSRALRLLSLDGEPILANYARNYPLPGADAYVPNGGERASFDDLTELWFWTRADYESLIRVRSDPAIAAELGHGCEQLFDRTISWLFLVEELVTPVDPSPS